MASDDLKKMRRLILAQDNYANNIKSGGKSAHYTQQVNDALASTLSHQISDKMDECDRGVEDKWGNPQKCHCLYCASRRNPDGTPNSCYIITTDKQKADMATVLDRYDNDDEQLRANLRWFTLLFSVYSFDLKAKSYPTFPLDIVKKNPMDKGSATGTIVFSRG